MEENIGETLEDIGVGDDFLDEDSQPQSTGKSQSAHMGLGQTQKLCNIKGTRVKRQLTEWEKIFAS